jgi:type III pantothenate kinase
MPKEVKRITAASNWPLEMHYDTPQTLGLDRLLLANATWLEFQQDLLVITMGTCITYNIVKNRSFKGGAISPGMQMRFRAMNDYTSALPLAEGNPEAPILGTSTEGSLQAGVNVAIAKEVEGMSAQFCHEFDLNTVVICGGDRNALRNHLKKHIFAPSNYELHALKRIHEYFKNQGLS